MNGIDVARRVRELSPSSKILFLSENRSTNIAEKALQIGALGYVVKSDAVRELFARDRSRCHSSKLSALAESTIWQ